jgi:hypothetical protein
VHLTLLVPELIWPEPADQRALEKPAAPGCEWLLARASSERKPRRPFETALADCFGITDAPFGALRLLGEGNDEARAGYWLCADPVHLRLYQERIILADADAFDLGADEAEAIVHGLNEEFADIGVCSMWPRARRWYLRTECCGRPSEWRRFPPSPAAASTATINGSALPLTRWLNEVQMFLHCHPANARRASCRQTCRQQPMALGWRAAARSAGTGFRRRLERQPAGHRPGHRQRHPPPCPTGLSGLLADADPHTSQLVVLDSLLPPVLYENGEDWRNAWTALERDWFQPLRAELGRRVETLNIVAPTIYGQLNWTLVGKDRWKFWRQAQPLADLAKTLAEEQTEGSAS